jgi:putative ABC transport system substrate-binding protein
VNRRDFITLLGGAAVAWPLATRAQQSERMRRVGVLMSQAADDPEAPIRIAALLQGLQQWGWSEGHNVRIDYRWGGGDADRIRRYAAELVALAPDIVLATASPAVERRKRSTLSSSRSTTIPMKPDCFMRAASDVDVVRLLQTSNGAEKYVC